MRHDSGESDAKLKEINTARPGTKLHISSFTTDNENASNEVKEPYRAVTARAGKSHVGSMIKLKQVPTNFGDQSKRSARGASELNFGLSMNDLSELDHTYSEANDVLGTDLDYFESEIAKLIQQQHLSKSPKGIRSSLLPMDGNFEE